MDAAELARWTRFAGKGGIGKCTALVDCVALKIGDLMFLKDDEIVVLMQLPEQGLYLGYCEGVVGRFQGEHVRFQSKLKKPILSKRGSASGSSLSKSSPPSLSPIPTVPAQELDGSASPASQNSPRSRGSDIPAPSQTSLQISHPLSESPSQSVADDDVLVPPSFSHSSNSSTSDSVLQTPPPLPDLEVRARPNGAHRSQPLAMSGEGSFHDSSGNSGRRSASLTRNVRTVVFDPKEQSFAESEPSTRISLATSEADVGNGMGLSLLRELAATTDGDGSTQHVSLDESYKAGSRVHQRASATSSLFPPSIAGSRPSFNRSSTGRSSDRVQMENGEDWEGASDIYDDYRYSRFSMADKSSRHSQSSGSILSEKPPLPHNEQEQAIERIKSMDSQHSYRTQSSANSSTSSTRMPSKRPPSMSAPAPQVSQSGDDRDASALSSDEHLSHLVLNSSPLLHSSFSSPLGSPSMDSVTSTISPTSSQDAGFPGIVSALRMKLETSRAPSRGLFESNEFGAAQRSQDWKIVMDDDDIDDDKLEMNRSSSSGLEDSSEFSDLADSSLASLASFASSLRTVTESSSAPIDADSNISSFGSTSLQSQTLTSAESLRAEPSITPSSSLSSSVPDALKPTLRPRPSTKTQSEFTRTSIFLPHPNAPKPPTSSAGPMYARKESIRYPPAQLHFPPPRESAVHVMKQIEAARFKSHPAIGHGPGWVPPRTLFGMCEQELAGATGPVPISFSLEQRQVGRGAGSPASRAGAAYAGGGPQQRAMTATPDFYSQQAAGRRSAQASPLPVSGREDSMNATQTGSPIPRANFVPHVDGARPRSRSFSDINTASQNGRVSVEPSIERKSPNQMVRTQSVPSSLTPSTASSSSHPALLVPRHTPSPLSLPRNNVVTPIPGSGPQRSPASPLFYSTTNFGVAQTVPSGADRHTSQKALVGMADVKAVVREDMLTSPTSPILSQRHQSVSDNAQNLKPANKTSLSSLADNPNPGHMGVSSPQPWLAQRKGSSDVESPHSDTRSLMTSPPPGGEIHASRSTSLSRDASLRKKLSLPVLRGKSSFHHSRRDDVASSSGSPVLSVTADNETVQVQDMDFELIRPTLPQTASARTSQDSVPMSREAPFEQKTDSGSLLRDTSSPLSMTFGDSQIALVDAAAASKTQKTADDPVSMDAHRHRELRWMSSLSSTPPSQSRKSKKIKRLLLEGVPSSVRYLVWCHLTDSKARALPGLYHQLGKRAKVSASKAMERDIEASFPEQPQLHSANGPLVSLLQAYLTMVPDVHYHSGLTFIAGHLLLLSPEEDAFWIFVSLMDAHLRAYFSSNPIQIEVDALLLSKAVEINDAEINKKLFVTLGMSPTKICRFWFSALFVGTLPVAYLHRMWDLFLYEGVPYLFRIALALLHCCRHLLLQSSSEEAALGYLRHPPIACLPSSPDAFLALTLSMKLKDDEIRKQRVKLEAQVKRQTQIRAVSVGGISGVDPAIISFPKS